MVSPPSDGVACEGGATAAGGFTAGFGAETAAGFAAGGVWAGRIQEGVAMGHFFQLGVAGRAEAAGAVAGFVAGAVVAGGGVSTFSSRAL